MAEDGLGFLGLFFLLPTTIALRWVLCLGSRTVPQTHPLGLEIASIRTRTNLTELTASRKPHLQIITMSGTKSDVSRTQPNLTIGQLKRLQTCLSMTSQFLMLILGSLTSRNLYHFHFTKLMRTDQSSRVTAITPRLGTETGRKRHVRNWQIRLIQNRLPVHIGQRNLSRGNQKRILAIALMTLRRNLEQILFKLGQLRRSLQRRSPHDIRHRHLRISMIVHVHIEEKR
mmetsp:Transcript_18121/g.26442  ORF Transcript_18121/g.26442 Transcript_18121/m.26442 type:complete len:229 (-) Transcript_18121:432-1118(-)